MGGTFTLTATQETPIKTVHIYVDAQIEFDIALHDQTATCKWLLDEVTKRYRALKTSGKRKKIVALKSTDQ